MKIKSKSRAEDTTARRHMEPAPSTVASNALPSFKSSFNTQKLHTYQGGTSKMVNVDAFPASKSVAGVFMTLEPGGLRELHWHANAAEWSYVFEGNMRVTILDPSGRSQIADLGPGDLWYFPKGYAHSLEGRGPGTATFLLAFDNGAFDEFATFDITDWIAHTPKEIVAKSLGLSIDEVGAPEEGGVHLPGRGAAPALEDESPRWTAVLDAAQPCLPPPRAEAVQGGPRRSSLARFAARVPDVDHDDGPLHAHPAGGSP